MPNAWRIGELTIAGVFMGISELVFCTAVLTIAKFRLGLGIEMLRTLAFVVIVFGNQATTYPNRERQRIGSARPSSCLIGSSVVIGVQYPSWLAEIIDNDDPFLPGGIQLTQKWVSR
jgi:hypothetical protein